LKRFSLGVEEVFSLDFKGVLEEGRVKMNGSISLVLLLLLQGFVHSKPSDNKLASPSYVKANLGTKTNYEPQGSISTHTPPPPTCRLFHMEYLARHGTRDPTSGKITAFTNIQDSIQNFLQQGGQFNPGYEWMATWQNPYINGRAGLLSHTGREEHYNTSKRMLDEYVSIMNTTYNPNRFRFQETQVSRTGVSASSFAFGMNEGRGTLGASKFAPPYIYSNNKDNDRELRFFDVCPLYNEEVLDNTTAYEQSRLFDATLETNAIALSKRLGTYPLWKINFSQFMTMWEICRAEASLDDDYTEFCSIFSVDDVDDLAYREDLEFYYKRGYGHEINYQIGVDLMNDIFGNIENGFAESQAFVEECRLRDPSGDCETKIKNIPYQLAGGFRFAHAETVTPIIAWMGFYETPSSIMRWDTPKEQRDQRAWKTGVLSPFSANLDFVVYACDEGGEAMVKVLHNEAEMPLGFCGGAVYCSWETFSHHYEQLLSLNFDTLCGTSSNCKKEL